MSNFVNHYNNDEIRNMINDEQDVDGGVAPAIVTATIGASVALCPTTKCSSCLLYTSPSPRD